jgi:hypothetical protein
MKDFDRDLMRDIKLIDAGPEGSVLWELHVTPAYSNLNSEWSRAVENRHHFPCINRGILQPGH